MESLNGYRSPTYLVNHDGSPAVYSLWVTVGDGKTHITEVWPGGHKAYVWTPANGAPGYWTMKHHAVQGVRIIAEDNVPRRVCRARDFAKNW